MKIYLDTRGIATNVDSMQNFRMWLWMQCHDRSPCTHTLMHSHSGKQETTPKRWRWRLTQTNKQIVGNVCCTNRPINGEWQNKRSQHWNGIKSLSCKKFLAGFCISVWRFYFLVWLGLAERIKLTMLVVIPMIGFVDTVTFPLVCDLFGSYGITLMMDVKYRLRVITWKMSELLLVVFLWKCIETTLFGDSTIKWHTNFGIDVDKKLKKK